MKRAIAMVIVFLTGLTAAAQSKTDEDAIRGILNEEIITWNQGDADGYATHFAADGTFTNVRGQFFTGRQAYRDRHEVIFKGPFLGTRLQMEVVSLRFLSPDIAVCETLSWVSDFKNGVPPNLYLDSNGRLRTRLLQVMVRRGDGWQVVVYHNVDIKPDVDTPAPK